jgi:hypothetical protein
MTRPPNFKGTRKDTGSNEHTALLMRMSVAFGMLIARLIPGSSSEKFF